MRAPRRTAARRRTARGALGEELQFLLANRIPRRLATRAFRWFSRIEQPLVSGASLRLWRLFSHLDLSDARKARFRSVHDCFVRELREGARPVDARPGILVSPCDAIVGAIGTVEGGTVLQVKGSPYGLARLLRDPAAAQAHEGGTYATLRLTPSMYHRFHAPHDCRVEAVTHVPGDTWNVDPVALGRVEALYCRNERAVIRTRLDRSGAPLTLVPVAAILVAGLRLRFLGLDATLRERGPRTIPCDAALRKGEEMGWFEHGSTIVVLAPEGSTPCAEVREGGRIRMGEGLMHLPDV